MSFTYDEWWLWGPQELLPHENKDEDDDGEDAYANFTKQQERKYGYANELS